MAITTEEFIRRAKEVHGDKYDYSKVEYVNNLTKVCIICPEHGEFWQIAKDHLRGQGCSKCAGKYVPTTEEWIEKAREVHGDRYDYSKTEYVNVKTKVCIICPEHGEFWQNPKHHLNGVGCPKCKGKTKLTIEEFVTKANKVHHNKFDYSKVDYVNAHTKVCIICPEHGEFWQTPNGHLTGSTCPKCANHFMDRDYFIEKARKIHGQKYDYSKVDYKGTDTKVCIICPEHGEFWQIPNSHLQGQGCPKCGVEKCANSLRLTTEEFIRRAKEVHGDKYDYSKVEYINNSTKVCIICPEHGEFWQTPIGHLSSKGCAKCARNIQLTTEDFIKKANERHNNKYDYSKVEYVNTHTKVCIICPEHGEFWQTPANHLKGFGCNVCAGRIINTGNFIKLAKEVHGEKYDYSKTNYINSQTKVRIICPIHGEFEQNPNGHLRGAGCPKCKAENARKKFSKSNEQFIEEARKIHGDKYDYSKVEYVNSNTKVKIICPIHGEFEQTPVSHLHGGHGCPNCQGLRKEYKFNLLEEFESEYAFKAFLMNNDINILQVILRNIEPKYEPIKADIEKMLKNKSEKDPIKALKDKYSSDYDEEEESENEIPTNVIDITTIDLDDDDAVDEILSTESKEGENEEETEPSIEDVIKNTEQEIKVINKIEHMLTPEDREYIMSKFLNDKRRIWIAKREKS